eukprot:3599076-Prymnesium_polylepis.1
MLRARRDCARAVESTWPLEKRVNGSPRQASGSAAHLRLQAVCTAAVAVFGCDLCRFARV